LELDETSEAEVRRLQETGRASFIVSVPKTWVQDLGLRKGSLVRMLRQQDGTLLLSTSQTRTAQKQTEVTVYLGSDQNPQSLVRRVIAFYLIGLNTIVLKSKDSRMSPNLRDAVREFVRTKLVGTEIVSESSTELVLQILLSYPELSAENALRRMVTIADQMHKDSVSALCEGKRDLAVQVLKSDDEVDRFAFYIVRQIKRAVEDERFLKEIGMKSARDCLGYRLITKSVERVADHAVLIANHAAELRESLTSRLASRMKELSEFSSLQFQEASQALFRGNYSMADGVLARQPQVETLEADIEKQIYRQDLSSEDVSSLRLILESLRRIGEYGTDIAEIVLNLTVHVTETAQRGSD
jgi:phosphate uptake regulator